MCCAPLAACPLLCGSARFRPGALLMVSPFAHRSDLILMSIGASGWPQELLSVVRDSTLTHAKTGTCSPKVLAMCLCLENAICSARSPQNVFCNVPDIKIYGRRSDCTGRKARLRTKIRKQFISPLVVLCCVPRSLLFNRDQRVFLAVTMAAGASRRSRLAERGRFLLHRCLLRNNTVPMKTVAALSLLASASAFAPASTGSRVRVLLSTPLGFLGRQTQRPETKNARRR